MKKIILMLFAFVAGLTTYAQTQSETLTENVWVLDHLVVNGEEIYMPEEVNVGDGMGGIFATYDNIVTLTFTLQQNNVYKVQSQLVMGQMISYHTIEEDNIPFDFTLGLFPSASSSSTEDWTYEDFKSSYLNDYAFGYGNGDYTIEDNVLTLGSETTYGVFNIFNPCDYMPLPEGNTEQTVNEGETLADLEVEAYPDTTLVWYADEELTEELDANTEVESGVTYYVVQADEQCTSGPLAITVTIINPCADYNAPQGETTQTIDEGQTLADLVVEGENLTWYADEELTEEVNPAETEPTDGDIFYVTQSNENCVSEPLMITITVLSSLNDVQMADLKVYPNPANDFINVSYTKNIESVTIVDFTGRKVMEKTIRAQEASLHINQLSTGTYLMNIQTTEGSAMIKFIKK